jgi:hypothetical protein
MTTGTATSALRHRVIDLDAPPGPPIEVDSPSPDLDPVELRDRLTRDRLSRLGARPDGHRVVRFRRNWWDGVAWVPSLVVHCPAGRYRLVESPSGIVALPARGAAARRRYRRYIRRAVADGAVGLLAASREAVPPQRSPWRRPDDAPTGLPTPPRWRTRTSLRIRVDQEADAVRCRHEGCAALVPIAPPGRLVGVAERCPGCGREP